MSDGFIKYSVLAAFFRITEDEMRNWLATSIAPDHLRVPGRSNGPRLADPEVRDSDLCTAADVCAFYRISPETLRRWQNIGKFPHPDGPVLGHSKLWRVLTARNPALKLKRQGAV